MGFFVQTTPVTMQVGEGQQVQIVQAQPQGQTQQPQSGTGQTMQVMQQIITNTGEIQQIPVRFGQEERWKSPPEQICEHEACFCLLC